MDERPPTDDMPQVEVDDTPPAGESVVPAGGDEHDEALDDEFEEEGRHRVLWTVALIAVALFVTIPVLFSLVPQLGAKFSYNKTFYDSWRGDRHRASANTCLDCHLQPGIRGIVTFPFMFYGEALTALSGGRIDPPVAALPTDATCRRSGCHSLNRIESLSRQIRVNHRLHAEKGEVPCIKCHPGAGHDGADGRFSQPPMKMCEECHQEQMSDCSYCHLTKTIPGQ